MDNEQGFFDSAAEVGLTKHLGGLGATEKLIALCHFGEGTHHFIPYCGRTSHISAPSLAPVI